MLQLSQQFLVKMLYLIGPDGLVNMSYVNFWKLLWMTYVHVLRFKISIKIIQRHCLNTGHKRNGVPFILNATDCTTVVFTLSPSHQVKPQSQLSGQHHYAVRVNFLLSHCLCFPTLIIYSDTPSGIKQLNYIFSQTVYNKLQLSPIIIHKWRLFD